MTGAESDEPERIGILGGTFDPVHVGHLMDAAAARHQLGLDRVMVVVARDPWQKRDRVIAPAAIRYDMVVAALDGVEGLVASRIEMEREGPTYTIDTIEALAAPGRELFLVMGSDVVAGLPTWHRVDELRGRVTLAIVDRETTPCPAPEGWRVARVSAPRRRGRADRVPRTHRRGADPARPRALRLGMIEGSRNRNERRRRRDRRLQAGVVLLAVLAGVVAGILGTHRSWERLPAPGASTTTTVARQTPLP